MKQALKILTEETPKEFFKRRGSGGPSITYAEKVNAIPWKTAHTFDVDSEAVAIGQHNMDFGEVRGEIVSAPHIYVKGELFESARGLFYVRVREMTIQWEGWDCCATWIGTLLDVPEHVHQEAGESPVERIRRMEAAVGSDVEVVPGTVYHVEDEAEHMEDEE